MTHTAEHTIFLLLGQLAGWLGVSIAIYLQVVNPRRCRPEYLWGFLILGGGLIIAHIGLLDFPAWRGWFPIIGYGILIAAQLYGAYWVHKHSDLPGPRQTFEEMGLFGQRN